MKVTELFEESRGQQLFQFLDYLDTRCPLKKADKERLKALGAHLLKKGWVFSTGPSNTAVTKFTIGTNEEGRHRLVLPEKHWKGSKDRLNYFYYKHGPQPQGPETTISSVDIDDLDYVLEALREFQPPPPV